MSKNRRHPCLGVLAICLALLVVACSRIDGGSAPSPPNALLPMAGNLLWKSVACSSTNCVVVGPAEIALETDLAGHWQIHPTNIEGARLRMVKLARDESIWVAIGEKGTVVTSENGKDWTLRPTGVTSDLLGVAQSPVTGRWVAVGFHGAIITSQDGRSWTQEPAPNPRDFRFVFAASNGHWIVGTTFRYVLSSDDGVAWREHELVDLFDRDPEVFGGAVNTNSTRWVLFGHKGFRFTSQDGEKWAPWPSLGGRDFSGIAVHPKTGAWKAVGDSGTIAASTDGADWQLECGPVAAPPSDQDDVGQDSSDDDRSSDEGSEFRNVGECPTIGASKDLRAVAAAPDGTLWITLGRDGAFLSSDGGHWQLAAQSWALLWDVSFLGTTHSWIAVGPGRVLRSSEIGNLTGGEIPILSKLRGVAVDSTGSRWVSVGKGGTVLWSADALHWTRVWGLPGVDYSDVRYNSGRWVAVGEMGTIISSRDGINWDVSAAPQPFSGPFSEVRVDGDTGRWVAIRTLGGLATSEDGQRWRMQDLPRTADSQPVSLADIAVSSKTHRWTAVGSGGSHGVMVTSGDGINWSVIELPTSTPLEKVSVSHSGNRWVAIGMDDTILTSGDGITWTAHSAELNENLTALAVGPDDQYWLAVGSSGGVSTSVDGISWQPQGHVFGRHVSQVTLSSDRQHWIAVGEEPGVYTSEDGTHWQHRSDGRMQAETPFAIVGLADGSRWVSVGDFGLFTLEPIVPRPNVARPPLWVDKPGHRGFQVNIDRRFDACQRLKVRLEAATAFHVTQEHGGLKYIGTPVDLDLSASSQGSVFLPLNPDTDLGLTTGRQFDYSVEVSCGDLKTHYPLQKAYEAVTWQPWWESLSAWWLVVVWYVLVSITLLTFYVLAPIVLLDLRGLFEYLDPIAKIKLWRTDVTVGELAHGLNAWMYPWLVKRPRVLDAWVERNAAKWRVAGFGAAAAMERYKDYYPLPCLVIHAGKYVDRPTPQILHDILSDRAHWIEISGTGGAGKTMLLLEMARWLANGSGVPNGIRRLPVVIEEDLSEKNTVMDVIARKWNPINAAPELDAPLLKALVKEGRLVPVFDRLSERSDETVRFVRALRGTVSVGLALVSTRVEGEYEGGNVRRIRPLPLESGGLMSFMAALLARHSRGKGLRLVRDQTGLADRIAKLVEVPDKGGEHAELPLTPLLVRIFVDRAVELVKGGHPLGELPTSIPQAIADYLKALNPEAPGTPNSLTTEQLFKAARVVARESLGNNFIPQDVSLEYLRKRLPNSEFGGSDALERLKLNGICVERGSGTRLVLAFAHDPIAEYLAAEECVHGILEVDGRLVGMLDEVAMSEFEQLCTSVRSKGVAAQGFLIALEVVWRERTKLGGQSAVGRL